ncbi:DUF188 domain-containing protein [Candidatus Woesearchaeota archaeon]|nr:DUF188 domain-containing protein [Candidatus Woesearchaeota archaeon]
MIPLTRRSVVRVVMDTNFMLLPGNYLLDIFGEIERLMQTSYELCVTTGTVDELEKLAEKKTKTAKSARLGLMLIKQKPLKTVRSSKAHVDDDIVEVIKKGEFVATQDRELKKRVLDKGAKIITMRSKSHLIIKER